MANFRGITYFRKLFVTHLMDQDEIDAILKGALSNPKTEDAPNEPQTQPDQTLVDDQGERTPKDEKAQPISGNIELLLDIPLSVSVELGRTKMAIRDVLQLSPGSIVELDKLIGEPVDLLVNDNLIARGEVVVFDENFGVRITDIINPADRLKGLK